MPIYRVQTCVHCTTLTYCHLSGWYDEYDGLHLLLISGSSAAKCRILFVLPVQKYVEQWLQEQQRGSLHRGAGLLTDSAALRSVSGVFQLIVLFFSGSQLYWFASHSVVFCEKSLRNPPLYATCTASSPFPPEQKRTLCHTQTQVDMNILESQPTKYWESLGFECRYLFSLAHTSEQLLPVLLGLVQSILDGQLSTFHLVHDAQLHLIAQLKAQPSK